MLGIGLSMTGGTAQGRWSPPAALIDLDFRQDRYLQAGAAKSFDDIFAYNGAGLRTFTSEAGTHVWAAHNLLAHSGDLAQGTAVAASATKTRLTAAAGTGTTVPEARRAGVTLPDAGTYTYSAHVRQVNLRYLAMTSEGYGSGAGGVTLFDLQGGTIATQGAGHLALVKPLADGSCICSITFTADGSALNGTLSAGMSDNAVSHAVTGPDGTEALDVFAQWVCRSDLGGMADNPDNALGAEFASYVPAEAAPVSKARRNAYVRGVLEGLLIEDEAAVNIVEQSHDFAAAYWVKNNQLAVAASGTIAGIPAWELTDSSATGFAHCAAGIGAIAGVHTASCLVRKNPSQTSLFSARLSVGSNQFCGISFDTVTGAIKDHWNSGLAVQPDGAKMRDVIDMGTHWFAWFTYDPSLLTGLNATADVQVFPAHDAVNLSPGAHVTGSHVCTAFQVTAGYTPGSFIPTAGRAASRPAETLAIRSSVLPATMPVAVSLALEGRMNFADTGSGAAARFFDWRADGGNHLSAGLNTAGTATGQIQVSSAHSGAASTASGAASACAPGLNVPFSFAARHPAAQLELAAKGDTAAGSPAPSALPDLAAAGIGLAPAFNGSFGRFRLWDRDLGSAGIGRIPA
ncbi:hypothetical protein K3720_16970 [Leisingera caerulea]|uniref:phage head spike fiber domain-containing protein n=1 Tax=Leisingera caerulea TaxID=506591 RepID=UPI0021A53235|nr:hypothetical protein [Leisingera caerulea]UWQ49567.1 hypothetical protein K3720_16970 [Leisingera caerulea]